MQSAGCRRRGGVKASFWPLREQSWRRRRLANVRVSRSCPPRQAGMSANGHRSEEVKNSASWLGHDSKFRRKAMLWWPNGRPQSVLMVKKPGDIPAKSMFLIIAEWLQSKGVKVLVEPAVCANEFPQYASWDRAAAIPDFCITLGGDGTVLYLAALFEDDKPMPPIMAFAMGTLGFLTPFDVDNYVELLDRVMNANEKAMFCTMRTRLRCELYKGESLKVVKHVFNECCIDRGLSNAFLSMDCFVDGEFVTTVQADGLILATPSGSTAYSLSAGGPMVAPSVPSILLTPMAPHSLSFRPIVLPETSDVVIHLPYTAKNSGRVTFDGRHTDTLDPNDSVRLTISNCPLPVITAAFMDNDWYVSIREKLMWNAVIKKDTPLDTRHSAKKLPFENRELTTQLQFPSCVVRPKRLDLSADWRSMPIYHALGGCSGDESTSSMDAHCDEMSELDGPTEA